MPQIYFEPTNFGLSPNADFYLDTILLKKGLNNFSDEQMAIIKQHPSYEKMLKDKVLALELDEEQNVGTTKEGTPPDNTIPANITSLSIAKAEPIIKAETNIQLLKQWLADPRTGIKDLVGNRLLELGEMPDV